jgi:hypothetical protein
MPLPVGMYNDYVAGSNITDTKGPTFTKICMKLIPLSRLHFGTFQHKKNVNMKIYRLVM